MAITGFSIESNKSMTGIDGSDFALFFHSENVTGAFYLKQGNYRRDLFEYFGDSGFRVKKPVKLKFTATMYSIFGSGGMCELIILKNGSVFNSIKNREYFNGSITADFSAGDMLLVRLYQEYKTCAAAVWGVLV